MTTNKTVSLSAIFLVLFFYSGFTAMASAAEAEMTLADCIAAAIRENRTIKNAYLDRVVQKYDLRVAEDKFTPKLQLTPSIQSTGGVQSIGGPVRTPLTPATTTTDFSGTVTELLPTGASINLNAKYDITSMATATQGRASSWSVSLTQPLLKGAGFDVNMASVRTARWNEQGNILSLKSTIMDTLVSVVTAYRTYIQAVKALEITRQSLERSRELLSTNQQLIAAGRMAAIEIVQSEADVADKEFSLLTSENAVDAARLALTKAIDIDKNSRIKPVAEVSEVPPIPFTLDQAVKLSFENRPDYLRSLLGYEAAKLQLITSKNNTLWDLSLSGGYGENYTGGASKGDASSASWITALRLTIPIGDLSIRQGYIAAEIGLRKMENDMARQRENIEIEVQDALRSAEMNKRQIKLAVRSRELSEQKVEIETEKLKAGRSTNFQLVSYQNDLVNAKNGELNAIITYFNALTSLEKTIGIALDRWGVTLEERKQ